MVSLLYLLKREKASSQHFYIPSSEKGHLFHSALPRRQTNTIKRFDHSMAHLKNNALSLDKDGRHLIHSARQCGGILEFRSARSLPCDLGRVPRCRCSTWKRVWGQRSVYDLWFWTSHALSEAPTFLSFLMFFI